jgi:hypothetical protein
VRAARSEQLPQAPGGSAFPLKIGSVFLVGPNFSISPPKSLLQALPVVVDGVIGQGRSEEFAAGDVLFVLFEQACNHRVQVLCRGMNPNKIPSEPH